MTIEWLVSLAGLALATLYTPGPNNIMLANSGATYGFRRTLPHMAGVAAGFPVMMFIVARFFAESFERSPALQSGVKYIGAAMILWMGWRIATAGRAKARGGAKPFTFLQAAAFQWVNPKAWTMIVAASASYMSGAAPNREALAAALVFLIGGMGSSTLWAGFGARIRRYLEDDARLRRFNMLMGALMAACVVILFV